MTDIEIANSIKLQPIENIAKKLNILSQELIKYGEYKAKVTAKPSTKAGKLILVTAINPTSAGIGKTTVSIGLADAFTLLNKSVCLALREPSLGPVFGIKGGATGGGYSQVVPMEDINLHFTGDLHAITSANNLLCSLIDNHIFQGNQLNIDENNILFHRCVDLNDRALREVTVGQGNKNGIPRKDGFTITAACEVMAILTLAIDLDDLKMRLGSIMIGLDKAGNPVYANQLKAENAMAILLKDALHPNLVQTLGGTPALIHCGPFANIAHGCNSIIATRLSMSLADYTITEAGFGADLGAEKFFDVKCRTAKLKPNAVVLVATIKALKLHGGVDKTKLDDENTAAISLGMPNLLKHIENITQIFKLPVVVTLNKYSSDTNNEIELVRNTVSKIGVPFVINDVWALGGKGALDLANTIIKLCDKDNSSFSFAYELNQTVEQKIKDIALKVYGAKDVIFAEAAKNAITNINKLKLNSLPVVIAKTQYSLSDDQKLLSRPKDFNITIRDIEIRTGSGFLVALAGNMMLMPGLNSEPAAINMTIDNNNIIKGLF
ncbi:c-1-tetrahydrofolate synthase cytoplasmic-related [Holotrichia oblita]|nr:c-1-tetrahydrofolate synthase cytoplasmic-related [Holotrichia oblita]